MSARQIDFNNCRNPADVFCLNSLDTEELTLYETVVTDISRLASTKIRLLAIRGIPVRDLAFVRNLPNLEKLYVFSYPAITDLTPLAGLKLKKLGFNPANVTKGIEAVRGMTTLAAIGTDFDHPYPPAEFWKKYDAGEFGKPGTGAAAPAPGP